MMMSLFDLMQQAQNGEGLDALAKNFGLDSTQTQAAMEALLPAFSQGFQRNASDPMGVAGFMQALSSGHHADYFDNMQAAMQPEAIQDGNGILGHIFGSKDVSRAIAGQASQAIGLNAETLKSMLPIIASMLMGGLHKQSTGKLNNGGASGGNIISDIIGQMMRQAGNNARQGRETLDQMTESQNPFGAENPFGRALEEIFKMPQSGSGGQAQQRQQRQAPTSGNPLEDLFRDMIAGGMPSQKQPQKHSQANPFEDAFGDMFKTGKKVQEDYQRGVESIFEQYLDGMNRRS